MTAPSTLRGPHEFRPQGRYGKRAKRCRLCFHPRASHPITVWTHARPYVRKRWWQ